MGGGGGIPLPIELKKKRIKQYTETIIEKETQVLLYLASSDPDQPSRFLKGLLTQSFYARKNKIQEPGLF